VSNNQQLKQSPQRRALLPVALLALGATISACGQSAAKLPSISGAGASFPSAAYQRWSADYAKETGNQVSYQSVGSGAGVRQFIAGTVDFGATDEQLKGEDFTSGAAGERGALQIPMLGGTVTPAYNNPDCPNLKLTQAQLADIFLGKITNWSALGCPSKPITVAHRFRWLRHHLCLHQLPELLLAGVGRESGAGQGGGLAGRRWRQRQ